MSDVSGFLIPAGFRFGATRAGLKASGRPDFALIVADESASAAALFTANRITAAPLTVDKAHLKATGGRVRVVAINAGNANCAAGQAGLDAAYATCAAAAVEFGCRPEEVFPSSTGVIGVPLPVEKLVAALPAVKAGLGAEPDHFQQVARAILTTDLVEKTAFVRLEIGGKEVRIAAVGKGSGMIHPRLVPGQAPAAPHATMLVYILTDAEVEPEVLQGMLNAAVEVSFNRISVATSLARQIVADGEGVQHVVELRVNGAASDADAVTVAKRIAHSPLVKTAWAGADPNWGRLMAAIGNSGAQIDPERIDIWFGELRICRDGGRAAEMDVAAAHAYLKQPEFSIAIELNQGDGSCVFWTTDLTAEYVRINADYST
jgi:glutamate N-acetyltransferase / amino-acid N-acetyltransferase